MGVIMPYIFSFLVIANAAMLGYLLLSGNKEEKALAQAQSQLQKPVSFEDTSQRLPPQIGKK